jgi:hypothetical protein
MLSSRASGLYEVDYSAAERDADASIAADPVGQDAETSTNAAMSSWRRQIFRSGSQNRESRATWPYNRLFGQMKRSALSVGNPVEGERHSAVKPNNLTSQLPVSRWHEQIGDPAIADGILDRRVHNAHGIEMRGESMRKERNPPQDEKKE